MQRPSSGIGHQASALIEASLMAAIIAILIIFAGTGLGARLFDYLFPDGIEGLARPADGRPADAQDRRARPRPPPRQPLIPRLAP